jgi:hypothetical protein
VGLARWLAAVGRRTANGGDDAGRGRLDVMGVIHA